MLCQGNSWKSGEEGGLLVVTSGYLGFLGFSQHPCSHLCIVLWERYGKLPHRYAPGTWEDAIVMLQYRSIALKRQRFANGRTFRCRLRHSQPLIVSHGNDSWFYLVTTLQLHILIHGAYSHATLT